MQNLYDMTQSFEYNVTYGPFWEGEFPQISKPKTQFEFLGHELNSQFGVSACPLTHGSRAVSVMSKLGYDMITYRSVRSVEWHGQKPPHWCYVNAPKQLTVEDLQNNIAGSFFPFPNQEISTANSFGIQSVKPEYWQKDFEIAQKNITKGQLLILSIMFSPEADGRNVIEDAEVVAKYANETSATVFEINLAHPNSGMKSLVYEDVVTSVAICKNVKKSIGSKHLMAKIGYYKDKNSLREFMKQTAGVVSGISSTNTYAMPIIDENNQEFFPGRAKAGVSGAAIRNLSMEQAKTMVEFKKELQLTDYVVIGIGGVTQSEHIQQYLDLGVDGVQSAAGVFADPLLASKYKEKDL